MKKGIIQWFIRLIKQDMRDFAVYENVKEKYKN